MSRARILIVHPQPSALTLLTSMLRSWGHEIDEAADDRVAARRAEGGGVDLLLAGVDPADADALELLSYMRRKHRQVPVILLSTSPSPERTQEALRLGALAVLRYPVPAAELRAAVIQALDPRTARPQPAGLPSGAPAATSPPASAATTAHPRATMDEQGGPHQPALPLAPVAAPVGAEQVARALGIVGYDPSLRQAIELAGTIAPTRTPVLIVGEPGTGKALLARLIHALGTRRDSPLVVFDCAAWAGVLDGRERPGGRSGADCDWAGTLHWAHGGTLFLDEVAGLPDPLQALLLQALREREFAGDGLHQLSPEVRFVLSTSANLAALVEGGRFRQDLYHRIGVVCLSLPPLRHRASDIEALAEHFRARSAHESGKDVVGFTHDALAALQRHDWPGNVRELEGVIRRGVALCQGARLTSGYLAPGFAASRPPLPTGIRPLREALEESERRIIIQALRALNWNRQETARALDINRTTLYIKIKKYDKFKSWDTARGRTGSGIS